MLPFALFGIDDLIIIIILAAIIVAALVSIALDLKKIRNDTKAAEAARAQQKALNDLQSLVDAVKATGSATAAQCAEMRRLLDVAISAGVSPFVTGAIKQQIDRLCPGS